MTPRTLVPQVVVTADGVPLAAEALLALGGVRVQQRLSLPTLCELTFGHPPGPLTAARSLTPGTELRVTIQGQVHPLFAGHVTAVEHLYGPARSREIRVRGYDRLHRLRQQQRVRAHVQVTPLDLAREVAAEVGLAVEAAVAGPHWPRLYQHRQSDLELLQEVAERCGLYLAVRDDILHLLTLDGLDEPLPLALGETLLEARLEVNGDAACRSVTAAGWDPLRVESHVASADVARVGREVLVEVLPDQVGSNGRRDLVDEGAAAHEHAEAMAQAELDRRLAAEVTLWGVAAGDPRLRPGAIVDISGVDETLAGRYVLTEVTHLINGQLGFVSELSSAPPPPRQRPRSAVATLGVVTQVNDPENLGRLRVTLPTYGDVESDWMMVLGIGAGKGKGLTALPDVDDRVLVLLAHEDPGQGIVLGGLHGMDGPPDSGVEGGAVRRYTLLTPGGQRIRLDDANDTLRLENSAGSFVELSPQMVRLHAAIGLEIEAPGQPIVIRGKTIDFQRG